MQPWDGNAHSFIGPEGAGHPSPRFAEAAKRDKAIKGNLRCQSYGTAAIAPTVTPGQPPISNANGVPASSPGLGRGTRTYPGKPIPMTSNRKAVVASSVISKYHFRERQWGHILSFNI